MAKIARIGDGGSHGGQIITGSPDVYVDGVKVARIGDYYSCPLEDHGVTPIITGSSTVFANGKGVARIGDRAACGSVIIGGSNDVNAGD